MNGRHDSRIHMIPIDQIVVLNPRQRGKRKFRQIIDNIGQIGLKKPITVAPSKNGDGKTKYNLVCGQGRLEAYQAHGQTEIPAIIIDAPKEDLLLMSLIENLAAGSTAPWSLPRRLRRSRTGATPVATSQRRPGSTPLTSRQS